MGYRFACQSFGYIPWHPFAEECLQQLKKAIDKSVTLHQPLPLERFLGSGAVCKTNNAHVLRIPIGIDSVLRINRSRILRVGPVGKNSATPGTIHGGPEHMLVVVVGDYPFGIVGIIFGLLGRYQSAFGKENANINAFHSF